MAPLHAPPATPAGADLDTKAQDLRAHGRDVGLILVGDSLELNAVAARRTGVRQRRVDRFIDLRRDLASGFASVGGTGASTGLARRAGRGAGCRASGARNPNNSRGIPAARRSSLSSGSRRARLDPALAEQFAVDGGYFLDRTPPSEIDRHMPARFRDKFRRQANLFSSPAWERCSQVDSDMAFAFGATAACTAAAAFAGENAGAEDGFRCRGE